jgi:hypothetical protein
MSSQPLGREVCAYDYRSSDGTLLFQAVRYEPKDFRLRRPDGHGGWIRSLKGIQRMPYRLPELQAALKENPEATVFLVEGEKDVDRLWAEGLVATTSAQGAESWKQSAVAMETALQGCNVVIIPDADDAGDTYAASAMRTLEPVAKSVQLLRLPRLTHSDKHGEDVSDWLDRFGGTPDELKELVARARVDPTPDLSPDTAHNLEGGDAGWPYRPSPHGLWRLIETAQGTIPLRIANFSARIAAEITLDDGIEEHRWFEIEVRITDVGRRISVPAERFAGMQWVPELLGARAIVAPGSSTKDHVRTAIQALSSDIVERRVFTHTGWRQVEGRWVYLHQDGAIGADGPVADVRVELPGDLRHFALPVPAAGAEAATAIRASLGMTECAPDGIMMPIFAAIWRAPLGHADFSLYLAGQTGEGKSELAALAQQHFGRAMDARHLPASWSSSANALEALGFATKDALVVVDDFVPTGGWSDVQRQHRDADRVLRAAGNGSGRQRMRADTTLRPAKPPRCLFLSTGEDIPRGTSLRARMFILELAPGSVNWKQVTQCQRDAAAGLYSRTMAGYVAWLARQYADISARVLRDVAELRTRAAASGRHRRTPDVVANLAVGVRYFLRYAVDAGAITQLDAQTYWQRAWAALGVAADHQTQHQVAGNPVDRYLALVQAALATGDAYVADVRGGKPGNGDEAWGWQRRPPTADAHAPVEWMSRGRCIGWLEGDNLYLESEAAFAVADRLGQGTGDPLLVSAQTLRRRLHDRNLLQSVDKPRGTVTIRRTCEGQLRNVLHLSATTLFPRVEPDKSDKPVGAQADETAALETSRDSLPGLWGEMAGSGRDPTPSMLAPDEADIRFVGFVGSSAPRDQSRAENGAVVTLLPRGARNPAVNLTSAPDIDRPLPPDRDCYRCRQRCWQWDPDLRQWTYCEQRQGQAAVPSSTEATGS